MESKKELELDQDQSSWWSNDKRYSRPQQSQWLQSISSEFDTKMKMLLELIEVDGDSFAKRAEMYYQNRPKAIKTVQQLHKLYRALAEKCDQHKSESPDKPLNNEKEMQHGGQEDTGKWVLPNPSILNSSAEETIEDYLASGSESNGSGFEFHLPADSGTKSSENDGDGNMRKFWKLLEENLGKQAELIRRNDEKREEIIGLRNENRLLKSCKSNNGNQTADPKGKKKFKGFFCLPKRG